MCRIRGVECHALIAANRMPSTIALFASSRRNGNTGQLMDRIAQELQIDVIDLGEKNISAFDYEHRNRDDDFEPLIHQVLSFDQMIFASPVYWYSVAPPMKIFIDRLSDLLDVPDLLDTGRRLRNKTGFVVSTSVDDEPDAPFIEAFRATFNYLGMAYGGYINAKCVDDYVTDGHEDEIRAFVADVRSGKAY